MADSAIEFFRRKASLAVARATLAESLLEEHRRIVRDRGLAAIDTASELARLRDLVDWQRAEIDRIRERLRQLEAQQGAALERVLEAFALAIARAGAGLDTHAIERATAELQLALTQSPAGLAVLPTNAGQSAAPLSTVSFSLAPLPPRPGEGPAAGPMLRRRFERLAEALASRSARTPDSLAKTAAEELARDLRRVPADRDPDATWLADTAGRLRAFVPSLDATFAEMRAIAEATELDDAHRGEMIATLVDAAIEVVGGGR